jgi:hypothetical protein
MLTQFSRNSVSNAQFEPLPGLAILTLTTRSGCRADPWSSVTRDMGCAVITGKYPYHRDCIKQRRYLITPDTLAIGTKDPYIFVAIMLAFGTVH